MRAICDSSVNQGPFPDGNECMKDFLFVVFLSENDIELEVIKKKHPFFSH